MVWFTALTLVRVLWIQCRERGPRRRATLNRVIHLEDTGGGETDLTISFGFWDPESGRLGVENGRDQ